MSVATRKNYNLSDDSIVDRLNQDAHKMTPTRSNSKIQKIHLYDLPQIELYRNSNKPILGTDKTKTIKEKLDHEYESSIQFMNRQKNRELYVRYDENPFMDLDNKQKAKIHRVSAMKKDDKSPLKQSTKPKTKQYQLRNLVIELNNLHNHYPVLSTNELSTIKNDAVDLSSKIIRNVPKINYCFGDGKSNYEKQELKGEDGEKELSFDDILNIKQQNFYTKNDNKQLNIFRFPYDDSELIGRFQLQQYNFTFSSMAEKIHKMKVPIYRDISRLGRKMILNIPTGKQDRLDFVDSYELGFNIRDLKFADLMSIASGRFTQEYINNVLNFEGDYINKEQSQSSSELDNQQVDYRIGVDHKKSNAENTNENFQQIQSYLKLDYTEAEKRYENKCILRKDNIQMLIDKEEMLYSKTIKDKVIHIDLTAEIQQEMHEFMAMDQQRQKQVQKLIRMNKINKNKAECIKVNKLLQAVKSRKEQKQRIDHLLNRHK